MDWWHVARFVGYPLGLLALFVLMVYVEAAFEPVREWILARPPLKYLLATTNICGMLYMLWKITE